MPARKNNMVPERKVAKRMFLAVRRKQLLTSFKTDPLDLVLTE